MEISRQEDLYKNYRQERKEIKESIVKLEGMSKSIRRTPKRMGNSEARLHRMGGQKSKKKLDSFRKSLEGKLDGMEKVDKPDVNKTINIDLKESGRIYGRKLVYGDVEISYGNRKIIEKSYLSINNNTKTGIIGPNASGKTSLIREIIKSPKLTRASNLKLGYLSQDISQLRSEEDLITSILRESVHDQAFTRTVLARLLFKAEDMNKKLEDLSGGELIRYQLARLVLGDYNFLVLDEVTNHIDMESILALEATLKSYRGNLLLVSHDQDFIDGLVDNLIIIRDKKLIQYQGTYKEYLNQDKNKNSMDKVVLDLKITRVLSQLSDEEDEGKKKELEEEYLRLIRISKNN